jgi:glycosyltransferase involved in cell wall biosynthesis
MRILYHHRTQGEEPESVHIAAIVCALRGLGHAVDIVGPSRIPAPGAAARTHFLGGLKRCTPRAIVEWAQVLYNGVSLGKLVRALSRTRYQVIYERYALYNIAGVLAARIFQRPLILEVNTLYAQAWHKYYRLRLPGLARRLERHAIRSADAIVTVTGAMRSLLEQEGVRSERIVVTPNAVDPSQFEPSRFRGSELRRRLALEGVVAGFVGTMNRWQAMQGFAEVIERVARAGSDVHFLLVGEGEGRAALEAELHRRSLTRAVTFAGRQAHAAMPEFIAAMDIGLLLDSNDYGSPMKVFEYWAMGKAVIAAAVAPVREVMRDGQEGLLIEPGDAPAMARHVLALAADPERRARLGAAGRRRVLSAHTWRQNAATIVAAALAADRRRALRVGEAAE